MKHLAAILFLGISGCQSWYMIEPDWQTGEGCWRYGVVVSHEADAAPLTIPVFRMKDKEVERQCGDLRGCYIGKTSADWPAKITEPPYIVLPGPIFAGFFELNHARCHAFGSRHCAGAYARTATYGTDREWHCPEASLLWEQESRGVPVHEGS